MGRSELSKQLGNNTVNVSIEDCKECSLEAEKSHSQSQTAASEGEADHAGVDLIDNCLCLGAFQASERTASKIRNARVRSEDEGVIPHEKLHCI